jgi:hypothetical protein
MNASTDEESSTFTLENMARMAAMLGAMEFDKFYRGLTNAERNQLAPITGNLRALLGVDDIGQLFRDPVADAHDAFSKLIRKTEKTLDRPTARQVFARWLETLTEAVHDKKWGVLLRLFTMDDGPIVSRLAREMAADNEKFVPKAEQRGWSGTSERDLRRLIFREMQTLNKKLQEERPEEDC